MNRKTHRGRRTAITVVVGLVAVFVAVLATPAQAVQSVTSVNGAAFGYWSDGISLFGGPQGDVGPTPTVALASDASNTPQGAIAATGLVSYGPARLFTSDMITVNSAGSLGTSGSVTTTSDVQNINYAATQPSNTGSEVFGYPPPEADPAYINFNPDNLRTSVAGTATASPAGRTGSTTVTNGMVRTDAQSSTDCGSLVTPCGRAGETHTHSLTNPEGVVTIPTNPPPNYVVAGHLHLGATTTDYFVIVFNEQIVNGDGSITVNPVHEYLGYKYVNGQIVQDLSYAQGGSILHGHLYIGQVRAGVTSVNVNTAPVANDDGFDTDEDTALNGNVLANDTDADGDTLTASLVNGPSNGSLSLNADGSFTYTPSAGYSGSDSFTYTASDPGGLSDSGTVSITVNAVNDDPVANDDGYVTDEDVPLAVDAPGVLGNDTDAEGDTLTATLASGPANGSVSVNTDGSFTYTPNAGFSGSDSFTYTASDGNGGSATATVAITVNLVNATPVANDDGYATDEDTALIVDAPGVLGNDIDPDGESLVAALAGVPAHGSVALGPDGAFTYTPTAGYSGPDSFSYTATDPNGASDTATVAVTVNPANDAPDATDDAYSTDENTALEVGAPGVLGNDSDPDGDSLSLALATGPANGSLTLNADGSFSYIPNAGFSGSDSFTYTVSDGAASDTATVTITVVDVVAADLSVSIAESSDPVPPRSSVTYTVTVTNNGPDAASGVTLTGSVSGATLASFTPGKPTCVTSKGKNKVLTCNLGILAAGATTTVTITATTGGKLGTITANASVTSTTPDPVSGNNSDTETTLIQR